MTMDCEVLSGSRVPIKAWIRGVQLEEQARQQLANLASLPFVFKHVAAMPDVHWGMGATIGSVFATKGAIIPAAVGVDIGCGMVAQRTTLKASDLPDNLHGVRSAIEQAVPHGRTNNGRPGDRGAWGVSPYVSNDHLVTARRALEAICEKHPSIARAQPAALNHAGTLGTGNHFIEVCLDEAQRVWVMLHSGSRGIGNRIGTYFIQKAKEDMRRWFINLPDVDLAYLPQGSAVFDDYCGAVHWAQDYAALNRDLMLVAVLQALASSVRPFETDVAAVALPPQLRVLGAPLWRECHGDAQGCRLSEGGPTRDHSGQHGGAVLHRAGEGQSGVVYVLLAWSGTRHESDGSETPVHG